jgi:hypothetical protein
MSACQPSPSGSFWCSGQGSVSSECLLSQVYIGKTKETLDSENQDLDMTYTCGAQRHNLQLAPKCLSGKSGVSYNIVEKLFYSVGKYRIHCYSAHTENSLTTQQTAIHRVQNVLLLWKNLLRRGSHHFPPTHLIWYTLSLFSMDPLEQVHAPGLANTPLHAHTQIPTVAVLITYSYQR